MSTFACAQNSPTFPGEQDTQTGSDGDADSDSDTQGASIELGEGFLSAADPKLDGFGGWPLVFAVGSADSGDLSCAISLRRSEQSLALLDADVQDGSCTADWNGRDADGGYLSPGLVDVHVDLIDPQSTAPIFQLEAQVEVVRLGFAEINMGVYSTGARVPLLWAQMGGAAGVFYEYVADRAPFGMGTDVVEDPAAATLDLADGTPRPIPAPWTDMESLPLDSGSSDGVEQDTYNIPTAWVAGSDLEVTLTASTAAAGAPDGTAFESVAVRLVPPTGMVVEGDGLFSNGIQLNANLLDTPVPAVGRYTLELEWRFEVKPTDQETWQAVPGSVTTTHVLYGLVAQPAMGFTASPHRAWAEIVDTIANWVDGATADPVEVGNALVEHIYDDMGLSYDVQQGACTYTYYPSSSWDPGVWFSGCLFDIVAFQGRELGNVINCSDAAAILSTYANMVGVDFNYHILYNGSWYNNGFDLNYIQAIGGTVFDETPFASGGGSFSYHAVVGPADTTIYDATLALDGDGTPTAPPHTFMYPQDMDETDYLVALSSEWNLITVDYDEKVRLQSFTKGTVDDASIFASVVPDGMEITAVRDARTPGLPVTLAFSPRGAKRPAVLFTFLRTASPQAAADALLRWKRSLTGDLAILNGVGDRAFGNRGIVGFSRGTYMVSVRSVDSEFTVEDIAARADAIAAR